MKSESSKNVFAQIFRVMERRMSVLLLHLLFYLRTMVVATPAFSLMLTLFFYVAAAPFFVVFACIVAALSVTAATIL